MNVDVSCLCNSIFFVNKWKNMKNFQFTLNVDIYACTYLMDIYSFWGHWIKNWIFLRASLVVFLLVYAVSPLVRNKGKDKHRRKRETGENIIYAKRKYPLHEYGIERKPTEWRKNKEYNNFSCMNAFSMLKAFCIN